MSSNKKVHGIFAISTLLISSGLGMWAIATEHPNIATLILGTGILILSIKFFQISDPLARDFETFHQEQSHKQAGIDARNYADQVQRSELIVLGSAIQSHNLKNKEGKHYYQVSVQITEYLKPKQYKGNPTIGENIEVLSQHKVKPAQIYIWFLKPEESGYRSIHRSHWILWEPRHLHLIEPYLNKNV